MYKVLIYIIFLFAIVACNDNSINPADIKRSKFKEPLIRVNNKLVKKDVDRIYSYAKRHEWNLKESKIGFFYDIFETKNGDSIKVGNQVTMKYKLSLLDGTLCYDSDSLGLKRFVVGQAQVETGLEQAVLLMKYGDKARLILPPYLAYGILGDDNKIPMRSIIVYELEILQ